MLLNNELTQLEKDLNKKFPWIGNRRVMIPNGWFDLLANACHEIEAVISPDNPIDKFKYFFATVRDYKLELFIQYEFGDKSNAKELAVESLIQEMRSISEFICVNCGNKLTSKSHKYHELPNCGCTVPTKSNNDSVDQTKDKQIDHCIQEQLTMTDIGLICTESSESDGTSDSLFSSINLFDIKNVEAILADLSSTYSDRDVANKVKSTLNKLIKSGPSRVLKHMPSMLDELEQNFPNFTEVISMLKGIQALSNDTTVPKVPPTLLLGPPGLGKTMFAEALANSMGVPFRVMRMENQQASAGLVGTADFWSNSKSGLVFNLLAQEDYGNPVIVLDEVDKANVNAQYNPLNSLYNLLESNSARTFNDESLPDLSIDASKITWILTANSEESIPEAILSRVRVFKITKPNLAQSKAIATRIYTGILNDSDILKSRFKSNISDDVINYLAYLSPRKIKLSIETAFGNAAIAKRDTLTIDDFDMSKNTIKTKIGFI